MSRRLLSLLLAISFAAACMAQSSAPAEPRVFVIGDSISIRYGPYLEKLAAGTFAYDRKRDTAGEPKATGNLDVPTGANGGDSDMVLAYLRQRREHNPIAADILVVNCGLHDIKTDPVTGAIQVPIERYEQNLRAIVAEARAMNLRPVWIDTTPVIDEIHNARSKNFHRFARDVAAYNAVAARVMTEAGVPIIDLHGFTTAFLPDGFIDHVHYKADVCEKQAAFIFEKLRPLLAPPSATPAFGASAVPSSSIKILSDVPYLGPDRDEKLDVYLPSDSFIRPLPAVLLIHGGGWRIGDKAGKRERSIATDLAEQGYAVFSINYLLNKGDERDPATGKRKLTFIAWPQNFYDCKSALRWIRAESARYGIAPARIAVMGGSAGGHLSMLLGATVGNNEFNRHGLHTDQSNAVSCVLNLYGTYDVREGFDLPHFGGSTPGEIQAAKTAASPVTYMDASNPPTFITHGTADTTIPVERSRLLAEHLRRLGVDYWYVEIGGAKHAYDLRPAQMDLRPAVFAFLAKHLGEPGRKP
ncbi:MAG TPA: alpha/beta hydrolase fold domain-containing protein [Rariglobus sp.]